MLHNLEEKLAPAEVFTIKNIKKKIRGRYRFNIIIKAAPNGLPALREKLKIVVPADWHIDVDPVNLND
jgi:primosomal protein N'